MRDRILGPYRGYYAAAACILAGELGDQFQGWGKVFRHPASSVLDLGQVHSVHCERHHRTLDAALDEAEDLLFEAIDGLPEREAQIEPCASLNAILYVSGARGPTSIEQMQHLLWRARARNRDHQVTRMLLYFDGTFLQYLEGPAAQVQLIYRIIRKDPLHSGITTIVHQQIDSRVFGDWDMAFHMPGSELCTAETQAPELRAGLDARAVHALLAAFRHRGSAGGGLPKAGRPPVSGRGPRSAGSEEPGVP